VTQKDWLLMSLPIAGCNPWDHACHALNPIRNGTTSKTPEQTRIHPAIASEGLSKKALIWGFHAS